MFGVIDEEFYPGYLLLLIQWVISIVIMGFSLFY